MSEPGLAVSWPQLVADKAELLPYVLPRIVGEPARIDALPAAAELGARFTGLGTTLAEAIVALGPTAADAPARAMLPYLPRAVREIGDASTTTTPRTALRLLDYANAARCLGIELPDGFDALESSWLQALAARASAFPEAERFRIGLACVAAGLPREAARAVSGRLPERVDPAARFGFNVHDFVLHLAAAVALGAPRGATDAAWRDFVAGFPRKLAASSLDWPDLLWAARASLATIDRHDVATVARRLHALTNGA